MICRCVIGGRIRTMSRSRTTGVSTMRRRHITQDLASAWVIVPSVWARNHIWIHRVNRGRRLCRSNRQKLLGRGRILEEEFCVIPEYFSTFQMQNGCENFCWRAPFPTPPSYPTQILSPFITPWPLRHTDEILQNSKAHSKGNKFRI